MGDHISVGGTVFTFVDAADPLVVANGPAATEIAVSLTDDADAVALATVAVIDAIHGAGTATATGNVISLIDVSAESAIVTIMGDVSDLNVTLSGLQFLPEADYFGPASLTVVTEDFGQFTFDPAGQIHLLDSDRIEINITPVNDAPIMDNVPDQSIVEDSGSNSVTVTGITAGPVNELEGIRVNTTLNDSTSMAIAVGANVIGETITVAGTDFTLSLIHI